MTVPLLTAASILLAALAILPGSLGVLKLTYKLAATPRGAFLLFRLFKPIYLLSIILLVSAGFLAVQQCSSIALVIVGGFIVGGISIFGFLMHTSLMFKPVRRPLHIPVDEAVEKYGEEEEVVGVIDGHGVPYAYIARLQRRPHIVFETSAKPPFLSTHCILAHSSMAYELTGNFVQPQICIASVLANNLVFYEKDRHWAVQQVHNATRDGRNHLKTLPTVMTSLGTWQRLYPDSNVWFRNKEWRDTFYLKLLARASVIDQNSPDLVYPLQNDIDTRLPLKAYVNGVQIGEEAKAYPLDVFHERQVVEDCVGGEPIVFLASDNGDFVQLFSSKLEDGTSAQFHVSGEELQDIDTGSTWRVDGSCIMGKLEGQQLRAIPHYNKIFWFCWADFFPNTVIYAAEKQESAMSAT